MNEKLGNQVARHEFGHLPFEAEITQFINFAKENRITVLCDNVLLQTTVPQGKIVEQDTDDGKKIVQQYTFDFFNYAGIHRSVHLYTTPEVYVKGLAINTNVAERHGVVDFKIDLSENITNRFHVKTTIFDREGNNVGEVYADENLKGEILVQNANLWWPFLMHPTPGYLYTLEVKIIDNRDQQDIDVYRTKFGIRSLKWNETSFLINDKPIYFRGFGRHEDSDIRGKGLDYALLTKDFNLLKWIGANSYR
jgi:beta-glucuronidase